ncbi:M56 family metallopeptidase [Hyphobacterium sp. CCMP332]|nr:M56 family metallopeptidase [Hyphobacterium sp. CCMP332]
MNAIEFLNNLIPASVLGWAVIHTLWSGMLIWVLFLLGKNLFGRTTAFKYYWALGLQFLLFFSFSFAVFYELSFYNFENKGSINSEPAANIMASENLQNDSPFQITSLNESYIAELIEISTPFISVLWIIGALIMMMRFITNLMYIQNLKTTGIYEIENEWELKFKEILSKLRMKSKIRLFESDMIDSPLTLGFIKPVILVPIGMLSQIPYDQVEAILIHEIAHVKRADYLINVIQNIIEALVFFHPVTWILSTHIRTERENLCDDFSVHLQRNPIHLAKALVEIQRHSNHTPELALGSNNPKYVLRKRIERILNVEKNNSELTKSLIPVITLIIFILGLSLFQLSNRSEAGPDESGFLNMVSDLPFQEAYPPVPETTQMAMVEAPIQTIIQKKNKEISQQQVKVQPKINSSHSLLDHKNRNTFTMTLPGGDDEITIKKTSSDVKKIEIVFVDPRDIKKLKIDGKKIKEENFDDYVDLLNKEVFYSHGKNRNSNSFAYTYSDAEDNATVKVINSEPGRNEAIVSINSSPDDENVIVIKINGDDDQTRIIEIPDIDENFMEIQEDLEELFSDLDLDFEFEFEEKDEESDENDENKFTHRHLRQHRTETIEKNLEEAARALEQTSKKLEEKSKALQKELNAVEMQEVEEEIQEAIEEIQEEIENIQEKELKVKVKEKKIRAEAIAVEKTANEKGSKMSEMINELEQDGIIEEGIKKIKIAFEKGKMTVNGEVQNEEITRKYLDMFDIDESANIRYNKIED